MSTEDIITIAYLLICLTVAYFAGSIIEKKHFKNIRKRERDLIKFPTTCIGDNLICKNSKIKKMELVTGCAVIGSDYFKDFVSGFKTFFGGRMTSYESVIDRARREAVLRMRESALGANLIINMKLETTVLNDSVQNEPAQVAVLAYGTAITYE